MPCPAELEGKRPRGLEEGQRPEATGRGLQVEAKRARRGLEGGQQRCGGAGQVQRVEQRRHAHAHGPAAATQHQRKVALASGGIDGGERAGERMTEERGVYVWVSVCVCVCVCEVCV